MLFDEKEWDAIIVGAGPAGLSCGYYLAKSNPDKKILIVDKKQEIGTPVRCGEGLGLGWFKRMQLPEDKNWAVWPSYGAALYSPKGKKVVIRFPEIAGYVLERKVFEKWLARRAATAGAKIQCKTRVTSAKRENGKVKLEAEFLGEKIEYETKIVIAADGVDSKISRYLGLNTTGTLYHTDSGLQYQMAGISFEDSDLIQLWFGEKIAPRGYCLTPDTEVIARNTIKPITEISIGEEVLTLDGWMPVSGVSERNYAGEIIEVIPFMLNSNVKLTADHLVRVWNKNGFCWKPAKELVKGMRGKRRNGDYLIFPIPDEKKIDFIDVSKYSDGIEKKGLLYPIGKNQYKAKFPYKHGIKKKLEINNDLLEFFGYFVSEGNDNSNGIIISNCDKKIIERIKEIGKKTFGFNPSLFVQIKGNRKPCTQVQFPSKILKKVFASLCGSGCKNKKIPSFVFGLEEEKKKAFLKGLFLGDGCVEKSSEGYDVLSYISTSKTLIYDLWALLASMGIIGAVGKNKKKKAWRLRIRGKQLSELSNIFGKLNYGNKQNRGFFIKNNLVFMGIRLLKKEFYSGKVYDIESAGSFCPFFAVHNCWLFPKGKDFANVGIGILGSDTGLAKNYLDRFIESQPGLKKGSIIEINGGAIPVGGFLEEMTSDNLVAIGDAAHQVNPVHGGGIGLALESGQTAAETVSEAFKANNYSNSFLSRYNPLWYEKRGNELKRILKKRIMFEQLKDPDFELLASSFTGEDILKLTSGDMIETAKMVAKKLIKHPKLAGVLLKYIQNK